MYWGVANVTSDLQNFLSFAFSESKNIFQKNFSKKIFQNSEKFSNKIFQENFPERFFKNFLAFQESINKLMVGDEMYEKAKKDEGYSNSYYPSA